LEKPADKRAAFLDAMCESDLALRQRLEALLAAHEDAGEFVDYPVAAQGPKKTICAKPGR
jgi:hypothetical protein